MSTGDASVNEWDEVAGEWDDSESVRGYAMSVFESLHGILDEDALSLEGLRVVDFGCGTGLLTERLVGVGARVVAIDTSPAMLAVLDRKIADRGWTTVRTSTDLAIGDEQFDLVVCSSVLGFVDDYRTVVRDLSSMLRPGGLFVQWDWERTDGDDGGHGLSRSEISEALTAAGLEGIEVGPDFTIDIEGEVVRPLRGHGRRPVRRLDIER